MIKVKPFVDSLELEVLVPTTRTAWDIRTADFNRPGLQFAGFYDYFAYERPQVIGKVEMTYLDTLAPDVRAERLKAYFSYDIPCIVICRGMRCPQDLQELARAHDVPVYQSAMITTKFVLRAIIYLNKQLAPRQTQHGVLVDVFGVGILLTGDSGVGKSEAALELVKRGHQLVADDVVDICRVADDRLVGEAPEMVRHFMEIRGIGIIDISAMYGIGSVVPSKSIDIVIHLEMWVKDREYDRLGLHEEYTTILGVKIPQILMPVRPGRNLAIIVEVAARNFRLKHMGYNAAAELDKRLTALISRGRDED